MYKNIKIYTRTRCQVSVYRTTGPLVIQTFWIIRNCAILLKCKTDFLVLLGSVILLSGNHESILEQMHKMVKGLNCEF